MKLKTSALLIGMTLWLSGCANKMSTNGTHETVQNNYQNYVELSKQFQLDQKWWEGYADPELNRLIEQALANNLNLAKATIAVNRAYYNANLLGVNLVPTFSASGNSGSISASKGVGSSDNLHSTGISSLAGQLGLNLSYTLDLWGRLKESASAAEWEHKATQEDLQATRLAIINGVIGSYYNLAYYQDAIKLTERNIRTYEELHRIMKNKHSAGQIDQLNVDQSMQALLIAKNTLLNLQTAQKTAEQTLRNLLNLAPEQSPKLKLPQILKVKLQPVDLNVPVSVIANRPDVVSALHRFQSAFKNLRATENSWFPTVTLGASLSGNARNIADVAENPIAGGLLSFNLPFLDWARVKNNIHLSEESYKLAKINYEQTITTALNEIDHAYYAYRQSQNGYANLQKKHDSDKKISRYYQNRYEQGIIELREYLNALNTERTSELSLLEAKYLILRNENAVYQAMAGKYHK